MLISQILGMLTALLITSSASAQEPVQPVWSTGAPEQLPPVTVRWEDPGQQETFIVEGTRYQCRVATNPARILSLRVDGTDLLGDEGLKFSFTDADGNVYTPASPEVTPRWKYWRRDWVPASGSRARMNVWSAGPYYWDAHMLDIPMVTAGYEAALRTPSETLAQWDFDTDLEGWETLERCDVTWRDGALVAAPTGPDPFFQSPEVNVSGPINAVIRMRTRVGGGGAFYWYQDNEGGYSGDHVVTFGINGDGEWHEYRVGLNSVGTLKRLRFDPPGESGETEIDWLRLELQPEEVAGPQPVRGEVVFHAFPDQLRIEFRLDPNENQAAPENIIFKTNDALEAAPTSENRPLTILGRGDSQVALLGNVDAKLGADATWTAPCTGARPGAVWIIRPLAPQQPVTDALKDDLAPLNPNNIQVTGGDWLGYNQNSGLYEMQAKPELGAFGFEAAFMNPTRRVETSVKLVNDELPRNFYVKCYTGIGCLEAAVVADMNGFPLPVSAFVAKNFAGELEEPDDTAFGDSYFPLMLQPNEQREFKLFHLMQNWGDHMLKQVSSIRFFHIYWHLSNGASESTCYTMNWMQTNTGSIFHIPDFRPMSGPFWPGQPQHDCQQWPGFLQYNGGKTKLVYERTVFESVSPCLSRFTALYHTSDDAATAKVSYMEIPQRDEMRTFVKLRYDWQKPVTIEGDARVNFRWVNVCEFTHAPELLLWSDTEGETLSRPVVMDNKPMLLGEPVTADFPFAASHAPGDRYHCVTLVRSFKARLGGQEYEQPVLSAQFGPNNGDWWFTVPQENLTLQPGDFVEAEVMFMPHGEPTLPAFKPERERVERFGISSPKIKDISIGTKISDFPATVKADNDVAAFSFTGGFDYMPLIIEGMSDRGVPLLWNNGLWQTQQVHGGDGYQVEPDGQGGYRYIFVYPIRKDQTHNFTVTRASCSTGIARLIDESGRLAIEAVSEGEFSLKAPGLFGPGQNTVTAGASLRNFTGRAKLVRSLPVGVDISTGTAQVTLNADGTEVLVTGANAVVTFGSLANGSAYDVTVNGETSRKIAHAGIIQITTNVPETKIAIVRVTVLP